ncbi:hypothetical protein BH10BAC6_BH10BAC6_12070 [soil metagenome]
MTHYAIHAAIIFLMTSLWATAAESVVLPAETTLRAARSVSIPVRGTLSASSPSSVRIEFAYTPGSIRIRGAHGSATSAFRCANVVIIENTITDRTNGRLVIECSDVQALTDSLLCVLDVDALKGADSVGTITPTAIVINGTQVVGARLEGGKVLITDAGYGTVTSQTIVENYPNPFKESTTFTYTVGETTDVSFAVFDIYGRQYMTTEAESRTPGTYSFTFAPPIWEFASGTFVLEMKTNNGAVFHSFVRMK